MSSDRVKKRSSSSCARRRSTNRPIWLPTLVSIESRSSSGARISRLKNSMTLCTSPRSRIGKPNARAVLRARQSSRAENSCRATTSGIQTGCAAGPHPAGQTDAPAEGRRSTDRVEFRKLSWTGADQVSTQRRRSASRSIRQSAPYSQSSASQIASRILGAASPNVADSTSARAATCSAVRRRSGQPVAAQSASLGCHLGRVAIIVPAGGLGLESPAHPDHFPAWPGPPPRGGRGGRVPPSARIFMFCRARVNVAVRDALSFSRAASSANIELS